METNSIEIFKNPLSGLEQTQLSKKIIDAIIDGEINPIKAEISLKSMENVIKSIRENKDVKSITRTETDKYGKKFEMMGAEITNSSRTTFDYSVCNDEIYNDLVKQIENLKEQIKIREAVLKSGVDISTAETFEKPIAKVSEFLTIKFVK